MNNTESYTIVLDPGLLGYDRTIRMKVEVPVTADVEEYIDSLLDAILNDNCRYNAEWHFEEDGGNAVPD